MRTTSCYSTLYRALLWLLPFLFFLSSSVNAASIAPYGYLNTLGLQDSLESYCQSIIVAPHQFGDVSSSPVSSVVTSSAGGYIHYSTPGSGTYNLCLTTTNASYGYGTYYGQFCRISDGYSYTGGQLKCEVCPPGYSDVGGTCQQPPPECPSSGASVGHTLITGDITGSASIAGTELCISNPDHPSTPGAVCGVQCNSGAVSVDPVSGISQMYCQSASFTGSTCTGGSVAGADPGPDPDFGEQKEPSGNCPPGTASGQINDLDVCLPSGSTVSNDVKKTTQGNKTLTTTKNQTVNPDGSVTTTITNIYNDGTSSTSSTTTTTDDKINAGGNDSSNNGGKDGSEDMPIPDMDTSLGGFEALPTRVPDNPVFSTSIISTSATCPPPITFTVMDVDLSIDFEPICDLAPMIRAIMLILAGLVALRVVVSK